MDTEQGPVMRRALGEEWEKLHAAVAPPLRPDPGDGTVMHA
jgi:hypothetical protein